MNTRIKNQKTFILKKPQKKDIITLIIAQLICKNKPFLEHVIMLIKRKDVGDTPKENMILSQDRMYHINLLFHEMNHI